VGGGIYRVAGYSDDSDRRVYTILRDFAESHRKTKASKNALSHESRRSPANVFATERKRRAVLLDDNTIHSSRPAFFYSTVKSARARISAIRDLILEQSGLQAVFVRLFAYISPPLKLLRQLVPIIPFAPICFFMPRLHRERMLNNFSTG
jgi:hypothetical protein